MEPHGKFNFDFIIDSNIRNYEIPIKGEAKDYNGELKLLKTIPSIFIFIISICML